MITGKALLKYHSVRKARQFRQIEDPNVHIMEKRLPVKCMPEPSEEVLKRQVPEPDTCILFKIPLEKHCDSPIGWVSVLLVMACF